MYYMFEIMTKLSKAMVISNINFEKKIKFFEEKKLILQDEVYKSLLRIIILPQVFHKSFYHIISYLEDQSFCVHSIILNLYFWVKITQPLLCVLVWSSHMINGSKTSVY